MNNLKLWILNFFLLLCVVLGATILILKGNGNNNFHLDADVAKMIGFSCIAVPCIGWMLESVILILVNLKKEQWDRLEKIGKGIKNINKKASKK